MSENYEWEQLLFKNKSSNFLTAMNTLKYGSSVIYVGLRQWQD